MVKFAISGENGICNSYTVVCLPLRGDLARGLSPIQADKPWYNFFYATLISVDLAKYEILRAEVCNFWQERHNVCFPMYT